MMLNEAKEVMTLYPLQMIPAGMAILFRRQPACRL